MTGAEDANIAHVTGTPAGRLYTREPLQRHLRDALAIAQHSRSISISQGRPTVSTRVADHISVRRSDRQWASMSRRAPRTLANWFTLAGFYLVVSVRCHQAESLGTATTSASIRGRGIPGLRDRHVQLR
jgi:hypothetical protein